MAKDNNQYVIKTPYGAYINLHSNGTEILYCMTNTAHAQKYSDVEVRAIKEKFAFNWKRDNFLVCKVEVRYLEEISREWV